MKMGILEKVIGKFVTKDSSNNNAHQITSKVMEKKNENKMNIIVKRLITTLNKNKACCACCIQMKRVTVTT